MYARRAPTGPAVAIELPEAMKTPVPNVPPVVKIRLQFSSSRIERSHLWQQIVDADFAASFVAAAAQQYPASQGHQTTEQLTSQSAGPWVRE